MLIWHEPLVGCDLARGRRYERIDAKKTAVEEVPRRLEAEGKVSLLAGWPYIRQAWNALPS